MRASRSLAAAAALVAAAPLASAQLVPFTSDLKGSNEVPPVTTSATGTGTFCFDTTTKLLDYTVTVTGMSGTAAHIHDAPAGVPGPIIFPLSGGPTVWSGTVGPLSASDETKLFAGDLYVNVHSAAFPGGEVRDQLHDAGVPAVQAVRNALLAPPNPPAYLPDPAGGPVNGTTWSPLVDGSPSLWTPPLGPGSVFFVAISTGPSVPELFLGPTTGWTLVSIAPPNPFLVVGPVAAVPAPAPVAIGIPPSCGFVGVGLATQAVGVDLLTGIRLANAIDIVIG